MDYQMPLVEVKVEVTEDVEDMLYEIETTSAKDRRDQDRQDMNCVWNGIIEGASTNSTSKNYVPESTQLQHLVAFLMSMGLTDDQVTVIRETGIAGLPKQQLLEQMAKAQLKETQMETQTIKKREPSSDEESDSSQQNVQSPSASYEAVARPTTSQQIVQSPSATHETSQPIVEWPPVFHIPIEKFPPSLLLSLTNRKELTSGLQRILVQHLYEAIVSYTLYPQPWQFRSVVASLLTAFPHLGNGLTHTDAETAWRYRLSHKLRNKRRTKDHDLPQVERRRILIQHQKKARVKGNAVPSKRSLAFGCPNYLPTRPETEDDETIAKHIEFMKKETGKKQINYMAIHFSLACTFADRRKFIVQNSPSIQEIKEQYPGLFKPYELIEEFKRITAIDLTAAIAKSLHDYAEPLIKLATGEDPNPEISDEEKNETAMLCISRLMRETIEITAGSSETETPNVQAGKEPTLTFHNQDPGEDVVGEIRSEEILLCEVSGIIQGFTVLFASCYCCNTLYSKKHKNTMLFMQKIMAKVDMQGKSPMVTSTLKKLNSMRQ